MKVGGKSENAQVEGKWLHGDQLHTTEGGPVGQHGAATFVSVMFVDNQKEEDAFNLQAVDVQELRTFGSARDFSLLGRFSPFLRWVLF